MPSFWGHVLWTVSTHTLWCVGFAPLLQGPAQTQPHRFSRKCRALTLWCDCLPSLSLWSISILSLSPHPLPSQFPGRSGVLQRILCCLVTASLLLRYNREFFPASKGCGAVGAEMHAETWRWILALVLLMTSSPDASPTGDHAIRHSDIVLNPSCVATASRLSGILESVNALLVLVASAVRLTPITPLDPACGEIVVDGWQWRTAVRTVMSMEVCLHPSHRFFLFAFFFRVTLTAFLPNGVGPSDGFFEEPLPISCCCALYV